jgi:2-octaprenyl-6-methoxyphenol hydroxylase
MAATTPRPPAWPILIAGGGISSLAFALALRRGAGDAVTVTIAEPGPPHSASGGRAYAVSPASRLMLEALGIWPALAPIAQPIRAMRITDSRPQDAFRPDYLGFRAGEDETLGHLLEAAPIAEVLAEACREAGVTFLHERIEAPQAETSRIAVAMGGKPRHAALLVAADGARSRLREAAGIGWVGESYRQTALVATIAHGRDHEGVAIQHFLPAGPFAILPLAGSGRDLPHRSSIVWTEEEAVARRLLADETSADSALAERFGAELGEIRRETPLVGFPLGIGLARAFVAPRLALLGDAAHLIHPLAGQGLNLGLADAAALAEAVVDAVRLGLDPGAADVLATYERARRFDTVLLATLTDGLNRLFSNDSLAARTLRDLGLGLVDRSPLKRLFTAEAAGTTARAPRLMRGKAL